MERIGVFICNYNKAKTVVKCVAHIMEQTMRDIDICVVDNASEDNSVQLLRETYGDSISIVENPENLGGSGGFGRAIRIALEKDYRYFMLVDNDAFLESGVVEALFSHMEADPSTGICGAKILRLHAPDTLQDFGGRLDMDNYRFIGIMNNWEDLPRSNAVIECDYVASCCLMARTEAVRRFGGFPEENFIYWDDIEWCKRCRDHGYRVVVNSHARALHDASAWDVRNMFTYYYHHRNRCRFFAKTLPEDRLSHFYDTVTRDLFATIYGASRKGMTGTSLTLQNAFEDFINGVSGKATAGRIAPYAAGENRLAERYKKARSILVCSPSRSSEDNLRLYSVMKAVSQYNAEAEIEAVLSLEGRCLSSYDMVIIPCEHVTKVGDNILPMIYVDRLRNAILTEEDYVYFSSFEEKLREFQESYRSAFERRCKALRKEGGVK